MSRPAGDGEATLDRAAADAARHRAGRHASSPSAAEHGARRDQFRRHRRPEPQLCRASASATSPPTANAGSTAFPRAAALQGVEKMRHNLAARPRPGHAPPAPPARTATGWPRSAPSVEDAPETLARRRFLRLGDVGGQCRDRLARPRHAPTAAATSPSPICGTMAHRSHEWPETLAQLRLAFADDAHFAVHAPVPATFGDEGAANHMRLCAAPRRAGRRGLRLRRARRRLPGAPACRGVARGRPAATGSIPTRTLFVAQSEEAIAAGAFHNDVVAVANEHVLFAHEQAFADKAGFYAALKRLLPEVEIVEVPASAGQPRRRDQILSVQRPAGHPARRRHGADPARGSARDAGGLGLARGDGRRQRPDPAAVRGRRAPVHGQWRRPGLPAGCASSPIRRRSTRASWSTTAKLDRIAACIAAPLARADRAGRPRRPGLVGADRGGAVAPCSSCSTSKPCSERVCFLRRRRKPMPAKSAAQQKAAGAALSAKRGDTPKSKLKGASQPDGRIDDRKAARGIRLDQAQGQARARRH